MEMARSFLKDKNLPATFWAEAVRHSVYILNRLPTRALSGVTPYEAWFLRKPDIAHVRIFGCLAHMKLPTNQVTKLSDRSKIVINLGKEPMTKAYMVYDPVEDRVHVSRDVIFEEDKGWNWESTKALENELHGTFAVFSPYAEVNRNDGDGENLQSPQTGQLSERESSVELSPSPTQDTNTEDGSEPPRKYRQLSEVYNASTEVELDDDELMLMGTIEPTSYSKAATEHSWKKAMENEIESVERNQTWRLTELPAGKKAIGLKWVYKVKKDASGKVVKHKARIVAKGYVQQQGRDFDEIFAPVTRLETVRLLLALAAKNSWEVHHLDVKSAFLNGEIQEEVYVTQPEGFEKKGKEHLVYRL